MYSGTGIEGCQEPSTINKECAERIRDNMQAEMSLILGIKGE